MRSSYHVYGLGAALVDTEIEVTDVFLAEAGIAKGHMTLVDEARQHELLALLGNHLVGARRASGGSAANTVIAASCFGADAYYSCKVADDDNGQFYLHDLAAAGVDANADGEGAGGDGITGKCLVMITPDAERTMNTFLGISASLSTDEINTEALARSEYLYAEGYLVTSPSGRAAAIHARELAHKHGVKTALSLSDPGMVEYFGDGLAEMIGNGVDLLFCNREEALGFTGASDIAQAADRLVRHARNFAITLGADGALVFDGREMAEIAPHPVRAIDTNGAGDMFAGAFLYGLTHGLSHADAGRLAARSAAELVCHYGPRLPTELHVELRREVLQH